MSKRSEGRNMMSAKAGICLAARWPDAEQTA